MRRSRAAFLDRDGVLNELVYFEEAGIIDSPFHEKHVRLLPGVAQAIRILHALDYEVVVASNQPGVAKGHMSLAGLDRVTRRLENLLAEEGAHLDAVYYCLHHPQGSVPKWTSDCECRKPKPGLLLRASAERGIDLSQSVFIGDSVTDVQAGLAAGCRTVLVGSLRCDLCQHLEERGIRPHRIASSLREAAQLLLTKEGVLDEAVHRHR